MYFIIYLIISKTGGGSMLDPNKTIQFSIKDEHEEEMRQTIVAVYEALREKGYNPISQIVGYILSEDPTYITTHNNARSLIRRLDRDELLQALVKNYLHLDADEKWGETKQYGWKRKTGFSDL